VPRFYSLHELTWSASLSLFNRSCCELSRRNTRRQWTSYNGPGDILCQSGRFFSTVDRGHDTSRHEARLARRFASLLPFLVSLPRVHTTASISKYISEIHLGYNGGPSVNLGALGGKPGFGMCWTSHVLQPRHATTLALRGICISHAIRYV
jgi:hypothetical protein